MKLAPHLHRIGNDIIAAYLVVTDDGVTVVDAGLPGHWRDLVRELDGLGLSPADIKGVVLTHGDSDHLGFAEHLRRDHGVPVYVHAADAERARTGESPKVAMGPMRLLPTLGFFAYGLRKRAMPTIHVKEVVEVHDGEVLDLPGSPEIIGMPGHSPGSIAVHVPVADAVFVGDALTTRHVLTGRGGLQPAPFTDDPAEASASLERLAGVQASWVLPGHGAPWRGSPAALADAVRAGAAWAGPPTAKGASFLLRHHRSDSPQQERGAAARNRGQRGGGQPWKSSGSTSSRNFLNSSSRSVASLWVSTSGTPASASTSSATQIGVPPREARATASDGRASMTRSPSAVDRVISA